MSNEPVNVILTAGGSWVLHFGGSDERTICNTAEAVYRDWAARNMAVSVTVQSRDPAVQSRLQAYFEGVARELFVPPGTIGWTPNRAD